MTKRIPMSIILAAFLLSLPPSARSAGQTQATGGAAGAAVRAQAGPGVSFQIGADQIAPRFAQAQNLLEGALSKVVSIPAEQRTFANTVKAYEAASAAFSEQIQSLVFLAYVSPNIEVQKAAQKVEEEAGTYGVALGARADLYRAIKEFADKKETLPAEDARLLDTLMRGFKTSGHGLSPDDKAKLQAIQERLTVLSTQFEGNLNAEDGFTEMTREDLKGLPNDYIDGLAKTPEGKYRVTLKYPDYIPFMRSAENSELRRQMQLKYANRAAEKNLPLLAEALRLRDQSAKLLGYESYPHLALDGRMAETPQKVWDFLNRLWPILRVKGEKELAALLAVKRQEDPAAARVESWDLSYLGNKLRKAQYDLDVEEVKQYFPVDRVVEGTMKVYQRILGVKFSEVASPDVWHKDVRLFRIDDEKTGAEIGYFYVDMFPRQGKYGHAAAFTIIQGRELEVGGYRKPVSAMVANFPKATADAPALMPHGDVKTFFHEFGHLMHQTLTKSRYATFAGSSVAQDFVEAPSQMLENFVWQREVLDEISGHYKDPAKKLPEALYQKMLAARSFGNGLHYLTQLAYALIDMTFHTAVPVETSRLYNQLMELVGLIPVQPGSHSEASFGHLMGGYGSGYYSYLWSEVFADDIFTRFAKEGLFNPAVGQAWRTEVLEVGSSRPEKDSLRAFLGREPNETAFMEKLQGPVSADDAYWALRRSVEEKAAAWQALGIADSLTVSREGSGILVRAAVWPEDLARPGSEDELREKLRKAVPELKGYPIKLVFLGVGA